MSHREMRNHSGEILRRVADGESFVVTNNGTEAALHLPYTSDARGRLAASGRLKVGRGLHLPTLPARVTPTVPTPEVLDEDRSR